MIDLLDIWCFFLHSFYLDSGKSSKVGGIWFFHRILCSAAELFVQWKHKNCKSSCSEQAFCVLLKIYKDLNTTVFNPSQLATLTCVWMGVLEAQHTNIAAQISSHYFYGRLTASI